MHRTDAPGHVGNMYSAGDPGAGIISTRLGADHANALQEEIANVIEANGITLNKPDNTQLQQAIFLNTQSLINFSLKRNSVTQFQIQRVDAIRNFISVQSEIVSVTTPKICDTTDNLLAADGTDSAGAPGASTLYYAYCSNSQASYQPSSLRLSASSPASGGEYLATSGNGSLWRFVGALYLNGSTQIGDDAAIGQKGFRLHRVILAANTVRSSGAAQFYTLFSIPNVVLLLGNRLLINVHVNGGWDVTADVEVRLLVGGTEIKRVNHSSTSSTISFELPHVEVEAGSHNQKAVLVEYWYTSTDTITILGDANGKRSHIDILRVLP